MAKLQFVKIPWSWILQSYQIVCNFSFKFVWLEIANLYCWTFGSVAMFYLTIELLNISMCNLLLFELLKYELLEISLDDIPMSSF